MVTVRKSTSKSRHGCRTCKTRHVKCDESQPHCQRCTSTGRDCDGYSKESPPTSPASGILVANPMAPSLRHISDREEAQEQRSFDFFRTQTAPGIAGFFGSPAWKLVLQVCSREPVISQAVVALGALHERSSINCVGGLRPIETDFPLRQYSKALGSLRQYLSSTTDLNLDIVLICALIHISIEIIQNNHANASVHLENSLLLLQQSGRKAQNTTPGLFSPSSLLKSPKIDSDLARAFLRLDLHASTYQGMRAPALAAFHEEDIMPARFLSLKQAKDTLDFITGELYSLIRNVIEEYRYRKDIDIPVNAVAQATRLKDAFEAWKELFETYLDCSSSRFSRKEHLAINILLINHRLGTIEAATCLHLETTIFDQFDNEFDEIVTLAASIIQARSTASVRFPGFSLDSAVIYPLYWTTIKCREPLIRQRAMSLLENITFREGVWNAAAQAGIARVAISREQEYCGGALSPSQRPAEFARVHSVGTEFLDPVNRVAEVHLTQKLSGLDGPWSCHVERISW